MVIAPEYTTLARLAVRLQVSFATVEAVVRTENIAPAMILDGIPRYDGPAVERITRAVQAAEQCDKGGAE